MKDDGKYYLLLDEVQRFFVMILSFYSNFFFHQHFLILHSNTIGRYIGRDLELLAFCICDYRVFDQMPDPFRNDG